MDANPRDPMHDELLADRSARLVTPGPRHGRTHAAMTAAADMSLVNAATREWTDQELFGDAFAPHPPRGKGTHADRRAARKRQRAARKRNR